MKGYFFNFTAFYFLRRKISRDYYVYSDILHLLYLYFPARLSVMLHNSIVYNKSQNRPLGVIMTNAEKAGVTCFQTD
jgi:hypothetical protein